MWSVNWFEKFNAVGYSSFQNDIQIKQSEEEDKKPSAQDLKNKYLIIASSDKQVFLLEPLIKPSDSNSLKLTILNCLNCNVPLSYYNHTRISLVKTIEKKSIVLVMAQHSPIHYFFRIYFDTLADK